MRIDSAVHRGTRAATALKSRRRADGVAAMEYCELISVTYVVIVAAAQGSGCVVSGTLTTAALRAAPANTTSPS
jgi:hypothetical protein